MPGDGFQNGAGGRLHRMLGIGRHRRARRAQKEEVEGQWRVCSCSTQASASVRPSTWFQRASSTSANRPGDAAPASCDAANAGPAARDLGEKPSDRRRVAEVGGDGLDRRPADAQTVEGRLGVGRRRVAVRQQHVASALAHHPLRHGQRVAVQRAADQVAGLGRQGRLRARPHHHRVDGVGEDQLADVLGARQRREGRAGRGDRVRSVREGRVGAVGEPRRDAFERRPDQRRTVGGDVLQVDCRERAILVQRPQCRAPSGERIAAAKLDEATVGREQRQARLDASPVSR
ncbi:MAG: hypothetical protein U0802_05945 [Candidatus Binatia bacterium]